MPVQQPAQVPLLLTPWSTAAFLAAGVSSAFQAEGQLWPSSPTGGAGWHLPLLTMVSFNSRASLHDPKKYELRKVAKDCACHVAGGGVGVGKARQNYPLPFCTPEPHLQSTCDL